MFNVRKYFTPCSNVSIVNFEHVIAGWGRANEFWSNLSKGSKWISIVFATIFFTLLWNKVLATYCWAISVCFGEQNRWQVSIWNATLSWNGLNKVSLWTNTCSYSTISFLWKNGFSFTIKSFIFEVPVKRKLKKIKRKLLFGGN